MRSLCRDDISEEPQRVVRRPSSQPGGVIHLVSVAGADVLPDAAQPLAIVLELERIKPVPSSASIAWPRSSGHLGTLKEAEPCEREFRGWPHAQGRIKRRRSFVSHKPGGVGTGPASHLVHPAEQGDHLFDPAGLQHLKRLHESEPPFRGRFVQQDGARLGAHYAYLPTVAPLRNPAPI